MAKTIQMKSTTSGVSENAYPITTPDRVLDSEGISIETKVSSKVDKITSAVENNIASFSTNGEIKDSTFSIETVEGASTAEASTSNYVSYNLQTGKSETEKANARTNIGAGTSTVSVSAAGESTEEVGYITINGVEKKLAGGSGVSEFDDLSGRPEYNGAQMTSETDIPEVKTTAWDAKYDKPSAGIPATDLTSDVQTILTDADTLKDDASQSGTVKKEITQTFTLTEDNAGYYSKGGSLLEPESYCHLILDNLEEGDVIISDKVIQVLAVWDGTTVNPDLGRNYDSSKGGFVLYEVPAGATKIAISRSFTWQATGTWTVTIIGPRTANVVNPDFLSNILLPASVGIEKTIDNLGKNPIHKENGKYLGYINVGKYITFGTNAAYSCAVFKCEASTTYTVDRTIRFLTQYDSDFILIKSDTDVAAGIFTTEETAAFFGVSLQNTPSFPTDLILTEGSSTTPTVTVSGYKWIFAEGIDENTPPAFLPSEICCAVGRTIEVYNNQVCPIADKYYFQWTCTVGKALGRKFSVTGTTESIGNYSLSLNIYDQWRNLKWTGSTTLKIVAATTESKTIVAIGDSLTNRKAWESELICLNNNFSLVGTREFSLADSTGVTRTGYQEGRSGWTAARYNQASDPSPSESSFTYVNPFYNTSTSHFDWNYYVTNSLSGTSPDIVMLYLGTNGLAENPTTNVTAIKTLVDYIRADDASIPIYLVNTLYGGNQNAIGVSRGSDGYSASLVGRWKLDHDMKIYNLMVKMKEVFNSDDYTNLFFIPIALCHDSENNFGAVATAINPRADVTKQYDLMPIESIHPQAQGYYQMADIIFSTLSAHI